MDKRIIICIAIIISIGVLVFLLFHYFEIKKIDAFVPPSREYYNNNYLALERWLTKAGIPVKYLNEYEIDLDEQESLPKTYLFTNTRYFFPDKSWEDLLQLVKNGNNIVLCLNQSDTDIVLLSELGITTGTTPDYHTYSDDNTPDYHWRLKFDVENNNDYYCYYDIHNNIRIIRLSLEKGMLTLMGLPSFMWNSNIGKEANARLAWELLTSVDNELIIIQDYRETPARKTLFGTLMQRGNLFPVLVSLFLLTLFGFWSVIPVFGLVKDDRKKNSRPIKERFAAEISFLKKYKGLYYYDEAINKLRGEE